MDHATDRLHRDTVLTSALGELVRLHGHLLCRARISLCYLQESLHGSVIRDSCVVE